MKKVLVLATGGAGGDLQPLMAAAIGLLERGHDVSFVGDAAAMQHSARLQLTDPVSVVCEALEVGL